MTFEEKRQLLHWLFDGRDQEGNRYGIYINKKGERKDAIVEYFMYGRLTGFRSVKETDAGSPIPSWQQKGTRYRKRQTIKSSYKTKRLGGLGKSNKE